MLDSFKNHSADDFRKRYRGTYGFFLKENGTKDIVFIDDVSSSQVSFSTPKGGGYFCFKDSDVVFEFIPPTRGWYWDKGYGRFVLIQRLPATQWQRGISRGNSSVTHLLSDCRWATSPLGYSTIEALVAPCKTASDAELKDGLNCLISRQFAIINGFVWFYAMKIGKYSAKDRTIILDNALVLQELSDQIRRQSLNLTVIAR